VTAKAPRVPIHWWSPHEQSLWGHQTTILPDYQAATYNGFRILLAQPTQRLELEVKRLAGQLQEFRAPAAKSDQPHPNAA
jgi:hypothetical protein